MSTGHWRPLEPALFPFLSLFLVVRFVLHFVSIRTVSTLRFCRWKNPSVRSNHKIHGAWYELDRSDRLHSTIAAGLLLINRGISFSIFCFFFSLPLPFFFLFFYTSPPTLSKLPSSLLTSSSPGSRHIVRGSSFFFFSFLFPFSFPFSSYSHRFPFSTSSSSDWDLPASNPFPCVTTALC